MFGNLFKVLSVLFMIRSSLQITNEHAGEHMISWGEYIWMDDSIVTSKRTNLLCRAPFTTTPNNLLLFMSYVICSLPHNWRTPLSEGRIPKRQTCCVLFNKLLCCTHPILGYPQCFCDKAPKMATWIDYCICGLVKLEQSLSGISYQGHENYCILFSKWVTLTI